jgi:ribosomal-protein-serine acetyltransferase
MFCIRIGGQTELALMEHRNAPELFALIEANRAHLRPWMSWLEQRRTLVDAATYIATGLKQFALGQGLHVGIWHDGKLCGIINCCPIDWPNKASYLEYWLGASHQGKGIMTMSCRAVVEHLFGTMDLHRLTIRCAAANHRSRAVAERLGFALEGISRDAEWIYDHFVNHAVYGLLKSDPRERAGADPSSAKS